MDDHKVGPCGLGSMLVLSSGRELVLAPMWNSS
jgi:hypothetical protein